MRKISLDECKKLHPQQWVNIYGIVSHRCEYINTCQVYQLDALVFNITRGWFEDVLLEPIDEDKQPIPTNKRF